MDPDKVLKERLTTARLLLVEIQEDLSDKTIDMKAAGKEGLFLGSQAGKDDDIFFCSILDDQLVVERFQQSGVAAGKLSAQLPIRIFNIKLQPVTSIDPFDPDALLVGLHYRSKGNGITNQVFNFKFSTKKVMVTGEDDLGKSFKKSLELNEIKDLQKGSLTDMEALKVVDIIATKEKIAVVKEIQFAQYSSVNSGGMWFRNDVLVLSIYDRSMKLLKTISLDKKYEANMPVGRSIGIKAMGEKLHFVMAAVEGVLKYATVYATVDLANQKLEQFKMLDKASIPKDRTIEGGASLWFDDGFLIEYLDAKGGALKSKKDFYSTWQKIKL